MQLNRRISLIAASLILSPALSYAAGAVAGDASLNYNWTLIGMVTLILILLFVIGMLAGTMRQLGQIVREKNRKARNGAGNVIRTVLLLFALAVPFTKAMAAEAQEAVAAPVSHSIQGIPESDFYLLVIIISLELVVIFMLSIYITVLLKVIKGEPEYSAEAKAVAQKSWFWDKFNAAATLEKEKDIMLDHDYDGIRELDNSLPPWWKYGFYLTIVVGIIYLYRFHVSHTGPSSEEEFVAEMQKGEEDKAEYLAKSANNVDENTVTLMTSESDIAAGKEVFVKNCAACHLADGGGSVGPNLTDEYWLHSGGIKDIFKSVKYGWQDKGMKSWKDDLSPKQIQQVASFIKSLKGTHPATPKAPQGDIYIEAGAPATDSAKVEKVAAK